MEKELKSKGLKVYPIQYASDKFGTMGDIKYFADALSIKVSRILSETGAKKVDIVAHSMGGLISRWYIEKGDGTNKVDKLIMLGTPNSGSELCYFLPGTNPFSRIKQLPLYMIYGISPEIAPGLALEQMAPGSPFLMSLGYNSRPNYYIIAGTSHNSGLLWLSGKILSAYDIACLGCNPKGNDGAVRYISATLFDAIPHRYDFAVNHSQETSDQTVMNQVYSILSGTEGSSSLLSNQEISEGINATNEIPAQSLPAIIGKIYPSEEKHHPINITSTQKAQFCLIGQDGNISLNLTTPSGISIDKSSAQNENNVTYDEDINPTLKSYAINNPEPGMWMADVKAIDISLEGEYYTILPFIDSNLTLDVNPTKYQFKPNEPIELKANLSNNSSPATGASVTAHYLKPDKLMENISLYDDGQHNDSQANDGIYGCTFTNSSLSGAYQVMVSANGTLDSQAFQLQESTIVWAEAYPDLNVSSGDISFSNSSPLPGQDVILNATIHNAGEATANNSFISFYDGSPESGELIANVSLNISARSTENIETIWNAVAGHHEIFVWISPYNSFLELNYSNNMANKSINVSIANNSCISGTKFNDTNSNATRDPGEAGLPGWTIRLTRPDGTSINATTDANGGYKFENLTSGTYRVSEIRQSNWTQTYPAWLGDHIINVTDGNVTDVDFGNNFLPVPEIPFPPAGPASGIPRAEYSYSTSAADPSGYQIAYTFDWGDGSNSTTGLFDSGAVASAAHIWNSSGIYEVRAMATNSKGASSRWSDPLVVTIANPIMGWKALGGVITSSPSAITDSQDKSEVWVKGGDNALWLNIDGYWQDKGGYLTSDPFAAEDYNGRIHVLARGGDNGAWDFIYDPVTQSGEWVGLGGYITEGLTAARDPANHNLMRVAAKGGDEALWTCDLDINTRSSSWSFQGGVLTSRPYIIFDPSGKEHILVRGGDNALWDRNGEWTGSSYTRTWSPLGGILANSPVATIEPGADSRIAVFVKGGDDAIWMCDVDSSSETETGSWHRLGGVISSDIFAVTDISRSKIHTFARGSDMALWENAFTTSPWNPDGGQWQYLGGSILDYRPGATIAAITQAFVIGTDNGLWQNMQVTASATAGDARSGEGDAERLHELSQNKQKEVKAKLELMKSNIIDRKVQVKQIKEMAAG